LLFTKLVVCGSEIIKAFFLIERDKKRLLLTVVLPSVGLQSSLWFF